MSLFVRPEVREYRTLLWILFSVFLAIAGLSLGASSRLPQLKTLWDVLDSLFVAAAWTAAVLLAISYWPKFKVLTSILGIIVGGSTIVWLIATSLPHRQPQNDWPYTLLDLRCNLWQKDTPNYKYVLPVGSSSKPWIFARYTNWYDDTKISDYSFATCTLKNYGPLPASEVLLQFVYLVRKKQTTQQLATPEIERLPMATVVVPGLGPNSKVVLQFLNDIPDRELFIEPSLYCRLTIVGMSRENCILPAEEGVPERFALEPMILEPFRTGTDCYGLPPTAPGTRMTEKVALPYSMPCGNGIATMPPWILRAKAIPANSGDPRGPIGPPPVSAMAAVPYGNPRYTAPIIEQGTVSSAQRYGYMVTIVDGVPLKGIECLTDRHLDFLVGDKIECKGIYYAEGKVHYIIAISVKRLP